MKQKASVQLTKLPQTKGKASTDEVLGVAGRDGKVSRKWEVHYRVLASLRDQFKGNKNRQSATAKEAISTFSEHMADAATDSYDRDWALAMASSDQNALYEIEHALNRIALGTYGICELTGELIESARLKAIPWTRFSAKAQAELEKRGVGIRTQLGSLGSCAHASDSEESVKDSTEEVQTDGNEKEPAMAA